MKPQYSTFSIGRRGRRGRSLYDGRWTQGFDELLRRPGLLRSSSVPITNVASGATTLSHGFKEGGELRSDSEDREVQTDIWDPEEPLPLFPEEENINEFDTAEGGADGDRLDGRDGSSNTSSHATNPEGRDVPSNEPHSSLESSEIPSKFGKICNWQAMLAFLLLNGTGRLSVEQYENVRVIINFFISLCLPGDAGLPAASTVRRTVQPTLQSWGFVDSELHPSSVDGTRIMANSPSSTRQAEERDNSSFVVVAPSSWSRMDVSFKLTWDILKQAASKFPSCNQQAAFSSIELTPIVADKDRVLDVLHTIVPTKLEPNSCTSPLLLSERCESPFIKLYFDSLPRFPQRMLQSNLREEEDGYTIHSACVRSVLVGSSPTSEDMMHPKDVVSSDDLEKGLLTALQFPFPGLWRSGDVCTLLKVSMESQSILFWFSNTSDATARHKS